MPTANQGAGGTADLPDATQLAVDRFLHEENAGHLIGPREFALVSLPLLLVLFFGWLWRLFLWVRFLWCLSHLDLHLIPAHPDHAAGLQFMDYSVLNFSLLGMALGAIVALCGHHPSYAKNAQATPLLAVGNDGIWQGARRPLPMTAFAMPHLLPL